MTSKPVRRAGGRARRAAAATRHRARRATRAAPGPAAAAAATSLGLPSSGAQRIEMRAVAKEPEPAAGAQQPMRPRGSRGAGRTRCSRRTPRRRGRSSRTEAARPRRSPRRAGSRARTRPGSGGRSRAGPASRRRRRGGRRASRARPRRTPCRSRARRRRGRRRRRGVPSDDSGTPKTPQRDLLLGPVVARSRVRVGGVRLRPVLAVPLRVVGDPGHGVILEAGRCSPEGRRPPESHVIVPRAGRRGRTATARALRSPSSRSRARCSPRGAWRSRRGSCPAAESAGFVAPIIPRTPRIAFSPRTASASTGPEVMNETSSPKNGFPLCSA